MALVSRLVSTFNSAGSDIRALQEMLIGMLQRDKNLGDVPDKALARANLGLGAVDNLSAGEIAATVQSNVLALPNSWGLTQTFQNVVIEGALTWAGLDDIEGGGAGAGIRPVVTVTNGSATLDYTEADTYLVPIAQPTAVSLVTPVGSSAARMYLIVIPNEGGLPSLTWATSVRWREGDTGQPKTGTTFTLFELFYLGPIVGWVGKQWADVEVAPSVVALVAASPYAAWAGFPGAVITPGTGIVLSPINRHLMPIPGSGDDKVNNPAVDIHNCISFTGDWDITIELTLPAAVADGYLYFFGMPPMIQDEWRMAVNQIDIEIQNSIAYWNTWDNAGMQLFGSEAVVVSGATTVLVTRRGLVVTLYVNGVEVIVTSALAYPQNRLFFGARVEGTGTMTIESITADAVGVGSTVQLVDLKPVPQPRTTNSLRALAAGNYPTLKIGTAVSAIPLAQDPEYAPVLGREFSQITPENAMKMQYIQPLQDKWDFYEADYIVDFAEKNNQEIHGHTLVWEEATPDWVWNGTWTAATLRTVMENHIATVVGRYAGKIKTWDVINEPFVEFTATIRPSKWFQVIGRDYIKYALIAANAADPFAKLFINEWGCESPGTKQNALFALCQELLTAGVPLHGVGLQMHEDMNDPEWQLETPNEASVSKAELMATIARFKTLGLQVRISEFDVNLHTPIPGDEASRAAYYGEILSGCIEAGASSLTMWGFTDKWSSNQEWYEYYDYGNSLIYDANYQARASYYALQTRLNQPPV